MEHFHITTYRSFGRINIYRQGELDTVPRDRFAICSDVKLPENLEYRVKMSRVSCEDRWW